MANEATRTLKETGALLEKSEMLLGVSRRVASISSIDEILAALVEMVSFELRAERATLFLNDASSGELYSRVAQGNLRREIRIPNTAGIAGHVFTTNEGLLVKDAYSSEYFDPAVDEQTGFTTESIAFSHPALHRPEMTIKGSRNALPRDFGRIIRLIEDGTIDTAPWITHRTPFDEVVAEFEGYTRPESGVIKAMIEVAE